MDVFIFSMEESNSNTSFYCSEARNGRHVNRTQYFSYTFLTFLTHYSYAFLTLFDAYEKRKKSVR